MTQEHLDTLLAFFKAMANESRLRIVGLLAERERSVQELAQALGLKEPTVSHHLAALKALGLVSVRAEGVIHWHRLETDALTGFNRVLLDKGAVTALAEPPETDAARIIANFLNEDGTLKHLPASRKKRWRVLEWLMEGFEDDRRYPEKEVNAILQQRHWDSATIRREMVGYRMLARQDNVYWRLPREGWMEVG
ncbi:MAG TPA: metalloregulator ArsR/SmtB family transcription factor [Phenylobacterium sp.]|nr:metalloregulator ArsR/SmtB family transcription factor [Phenylobacterium sp.]